VALGVDTPRGDADVAGFVAAGFQVERSTVLAAEAVREPPHLNSAALIRPLESEDDWRQSLELRLVRRLRG
jgi:hypothetical protein